MQEFQVIQNHAIGALALRQFVKGYRSRSVDKSGPILPLILPILPMVYNDDICSTLAEVRKITSSRFLTLLSDNRDLAVGLQDRMVKMSDQTFRSLNFAFAMKLLKYDPVTASLTSSNYLKKVPTLSYKDNQDIMHSAKVLGYWFASYSIEDICISLNIKF